MTKKLILFFIAVSIIFISVLIPPLVFFVEIVTPWGFLSENQWEELKNYMEETWWRLTVPFVGMCLFYSLMSKK